MHSSGSPAEDPGELANERTYTCTGYIKIRRAYNHLETRGTVVYRDHGSSPTHQRFLNYGPRPATVDAMC